MKNNQIEIKLKEIEINLINNYISINCISALLSLFLIITLIVNSSNELKVFFLFAILINLLSIVINFILMTDNINKKEKLKREYIKLLNK